jgi:hypothetical protein
MRKKVTDKKMSDSGKEKGAGLIVVILVMAFMVSVGIALITVTGTGSRVAANVRAQQEAFNAAEAGFDAAWIAIEDQFLNGAWTNFEGNTLVDPAGIDFPLDVNYFRKLTDQQVFDLLDADGNGSPDYGNIVFFKQEYVPLSGGGTDPRYTYTAFLIDDEAGGGTPDPLDVLLICIGTAGTGSSMTTSRIEVELVVQQR